MRKILQIMPANGWRYAEPIYEEQTCLMGVEIHPLIGWALVEDSGEVELVGMAATGFLTVGDGANLLSGDDLLIYIEPTADGTVSAHDRECLQTAIENWEETGKRNQKRRAQQEADYVARQAAKAPAAPPVMVEDGKPSGFRVRHD